MKRIILLLTLFSSTGLLGIEIDAILAEAKNDIVELSRQANPNFNQLKAHAEGLAQLRTKISFQQGANEESVIMNNWDYTLQQLYYAFNIYARRNTTDFADWLFGELDILSLAADTYKDKGIEEQILMRADYIVLSHLAEIIRGVPGLGKPVNNLITTIYHKVIN